MKKILSFFLAAALLAGMPAWAAEPPETKTGPDPANVEQPAAEEPTAAATEEPAQDTSDAVAIAAPCAVLMEKYTGTVIYEKASHQHCPPASVTKVMTMLLIVEAVEAGTVGLDTVVTASETACSMGGSQIWLEPGEQMSLSEMLKCVSVVSANDCAVALAELVAGSETAFVQRMNQRAAELGMKDTHFTNCTGLYDDDDHYTSAYDIALMSRELIQHDLIKQYTTIWMDSVRNGEFGLSNTNRLIYGFEGATGLKTGFTSKAMYCLSATAERDGVEYIAVVLHDETSDQRFADARALLTYGFANYTLAPLRPGEALPPIPVTLGTADSVQPRYTGEAYMLGEKSKLTSLAYDLTLAESVTAPVEQGQSLGRLTVRSGDAVVAEVDVVAEQAVPRLGFWTIYGRLFGAIIGLKSE